MRTSFREKVLSAVKRIPKGKVLTYAQVATRAGSPRAFRVVGTILKANFKSEIPCHRVIRSDGKPGAYNRGEARKRQLLISEGVRL